MADTKAPEAPTIPLDPWRDHRLESYLRMGFDEVQAALLANSRENDRDSKGKVWTRPLWVGRVRQALDRGCSHELAVAIYT